MWVLLSSSFDLYNDPVCFHELSILSTTTGLSAGLCGCRCWAETEFKWLRTTTFRFMTKFRMEWDPCSVLGPFFFYMVVSFPCHSKDNIPQQGWRFCFSQEQKRHYTRRDMPLGAGKGWLYIDIISPCFWPFQESSGSRWAWQLSNHKIKFQC